MNLRPSGYEPDELPDCSTPRWCVVSAGGGACVRVVGSVWRGALVCAPAGRPGGDLLSHALRRSTIGAEGFHGRVRDGIGCSPLAMATRSSGRRAGGVWACARRSRLLGEGRVVVRFLCGRVVAPGEGDGGIKPIERLGPVSFTHCCASTPGLSTWWSTTALGRDLVLRGASRLDAFSGYPVRT